MNLFVLGRQADISIAELEAIYGAEAIVAATHQVALVDSDVTDSSHLGGTQKVASVFHETSSLPSVSELHRILTKHATPAVLFGDQVIDSKRRLGLSLYDIDIDPKSITGMGLELKKTFKKSGVRIGVVPNKTAELSSAQVLHNGLANPNKGAEIILARVQSCYVLAVTRSVQDIDAYAARDQARPARDARVGMLPPKLAQIIVNIATQHTEAQAAILDPFCGTGVVLQEALLSGYSVHGSDISPEMIKATQTNLEWLQEQYTPSGTWSVEVGDATTHQWSVPIAAVASELFLGEPLTQQPSPQQVHALTQESHQLIHDFLANLASQIPTGTRICLAVPAWRTQRSFSPSLSVDDLKKLEYTTLSFKNISEELIYIRPDQFTGRRLLVLTKN